MDLTYDLEPLAAGAGHLEKLKARTGAKHKMKSTKKAAPYHELGTAFFIDVMSGNSFEAA